MARSAQKTKLFNGRDHSWMQFNRRVLEEAEDPANPLLERVKFLAITGSNLDEYVEIRQAGLMQRIEDGYREPGYDGLRPDESLSALTRRYSQFCRCAIPVLEQATAAGVAQARRSPAGVGGTERRRPRLCTRLLSARSRSAADPDLDRSRTPVSARAQQGAVPGAAAAGQARAAPGRKCWAWSRCRVPCPALCACPLINGHHDYLLLQDLIAQHLAGMYRGYEVLASASFPRHPQLEPLLRGGRGAVAAGNDSRGAAQPAQGRCGAAGD